MKKAFTLAEVLITLTIIGIVAALVIPSVIANAQQEEYKAGLKKAVGVLNQAILTNIALGEDTPATNGDLYEYFKEHMSISKTAVLASCYDEENGGQVEMSTGTYQEGTAPVCKNSKRVYNNVFYTPDGMRFEFSGMSMPSNVKLHEDNTIDLFASRGKKQVPGKEKSEYWSMDTMGYCGSNGLANNPNKTKRYPCVITVDVNGDKGPSKPLGISTTAGGAETGITNLTVFYKYAKPEDQRITDVFTLMVTERGVIPFGVAAQKAMYKDKEKKKKSQTDETDSQN